jgi:dUTP pyrophosphatase
MNTTIKFAKINPYAIIPTKRDEDAGYDIYPCFKKSYIAIMPHQTKMIPTGIASACDNNYCFILKERGSTGTKGIAQRCGIIDSGYRNEWFVPVTNTTDKLLIIGDENVAIQFKDYDVIFYPTTKAICQALVIPVPACKVEEVSYDELIKITSERGMGALGSSNK